MRNTILATAAIAFVALGTAFGVMKSEEIKNFFASKNLYNETTTEQAAVTETAADTQTASATPSTETAPAATTTEDAALNNQTPAAGEEKAAEATTEATTDATPAAETTEAAPAPETKAEEKKSTYVVDVAKALKDREVGSKNAPITVYDFSSLTCPHCAYFHTEIYPRVKENYIDKGKVRWVFRGFPLNDAALRAEMVARCAPEDQYEKLVDLMFKNQDRWAFTDSPLPNLNMLLRLAGINDDMFQACTTNKDLEMGLAKSAQIAGDKYKVSATPTFVFNDGLKTFSGAGSYEGFALDLDQMLQGISPSMSTSKKLAPAEDKPAENPLAPKK